MKLPRKIFEFKGFTLIELLVVVSILAILSGIISIVVVGALASSRDGRRISDLTTIKSTLEQYFADNKEYPSGATLRGTVWSEYSTEAVFLDDLTGSDYLDSKPEDPRNDLTDGYYYEYGNPNSGGADQSKFYTQSLLEKKDSGENIYQYCNNGATGEYYYMLFSSYTYRTTYTAEGTVGCDGCGAGVTCYDPVWD